MPGEGEGVTAAWHTFASRVCGDDSGGLDTGRQVATAAPGVARRGRAAASPATVAAFGEPVATTLLILTYVSNVVCEMAALALLFFCMAGRAT